MNVKFLIHHREPPGRAHSGAVAVKRIICAMILLSLLAPPGAASEMTDGPGGEIPVSHAAAASELLELLHTEKTINDSMEMMLNLQIETNAQMAPFEDVMREFLAKYMSWENLKGDFVDMYAGAFTESEINELIVFYQTGTGQKVITLMPELMQRGAVIGETRIQENMSELQEMLMQRVQELSDEESGGVSDPEVSEEEGSEPAEPGDAGER